MVRNKSCKMKLPLAVRTGAWTLAAVALCLPTAALLTLALLPLWSWIEREYGVEAVGHSGPSDWCYWLVFGSLSVIVLAVLFRSRWKEGADDR